MLHRRTIIAATPAALTLAANDCATSVTALASSRGENLGPAVLDSIDEFTVDLMKHDDATGGTATFPLAVAELNSVLALLKTGGHSATTERRLYCAAAELSRLAGWTAFDSGKAALGHRYSLAGLRAAQQGSAPEVGVNVARTLAQQEALSDDHSSALALMRSAQIGSKNRLTEAEIAGLHMVVLRAYSGARNQRGVAEAADQMFTHLERAEGTERPARVNWVCKGEFTGWCGEANLRLGNLDAAETQLTEAIERAETFKQRETTYWLNCLTRVYLARNQVEQACASASTALDRLALIQSPRIEQDFVQLRKQFADHHELQSVQDLDEKAEALLSRRSASAPETTRSAAMASLGSLEAT